MSGCNGCSGCGGEVRALLAELRSSRVLNMRGAPGQEVTFRHGPLAIIDVDVATPDTMLQLPPGTAYVEVSQHPTEAAPDGLGFAYPEHKAFFLPARLGDVFPVPEHGRIWLSKAIAVEASSGDSSGTARLVCWPTVLGEARAASAAAARGAVVAGAAASAMSREPKLLSSWTQTFSVVGTSTQAWEGTPPSWCRRLRLMGVVTAFGGTSPTLRMDAGYYDAGTGRRWNQTVAPYVRAASAGAYAALDGAYLMELSEEAPVALTTQNNLAHVVHHLPIARNADKNWLGFLLAGSSTPSVTLALRLWALP